MFNKLKYYLPNVAQSWLLIIILVLGGSIVVAIFTYFLKLLFPSLIEAISILSYPLIFIPPALFILFSLKRSLYSTSLKRSLYSTSFENSFMPSIEINRPNFGALRAGTSMVLIFLLVFSINFTTEPLTYWMGTPSFLEEFMNQIHANKVSTFISIVILAPILEELFCRGIILRGLLYHTSPTKAILISALLFGIMHLNPWQAIPAFILGAFMGWIYWRTHSLWATIFIHFINNGFSYVVTIMFPSLPSHFGFVDLIPQKYYYLFYAIALIYTVTVILIMNRKYDKIIPLKI